MTPRFVFCSQLGDDVYASLAAHSRQNKRIKGSPYQYLGPVRSKYSTDSKTMAKIRLRMGTTVESRPCRVIEDQGSRRRNGRFWAPARRDSGEAQSGNRPSAVTPPGDSNAVCRRDVRRRRYDADGLDPGDAGRVVAKHYYNAESNYQTDALNGSLDASDETVAYEYDAWGRQISVTQTLTAHTRVTENVYDDTYGRLIAVNAEFDGNPI